MSNKENKPVIDLLELWEEVEDMISEKRTIEGGNNHDFWCTERY